MSDKKGCGCFGIGCLVLVVVAGIVLGLLGFAGWQIYQGALEFTSTEPRQLPVVEVDPTQFQALQQRIDAFKQAEGEAELRLTGNDLNQFVHGSPNLKEARDKVYLTIVDGVTYSDVSIPLDAVPFMKGRWLNGQLGLAIDIQDGQPDIQVKSLTVGDKPVPSAFMDALQQQNLGQDLMQEPEVAQALNQVKSLTVEGNEIILRK